MFRQIFGPLLFLFIGVFIMFIVILPLLALVGCSEIKTYDSCTETGGIWIKYENIIYCQHRILNDHKH